MSETSAAGKTSIPINGHDLHCKAHYPHLTDATMCLWCTVIRVVRDEEQTYAMKAYNNGYADAQEDLDIAYWQGYNNAMIEVSMNKDNGPMSTNGDNDATSNN